MHLSFRWTIPLISKQIHFVSNVPYLIHGRVGKSLQSKGVDSAAIEILQVAKDRMCVNCKSLRVLLSHMWQRTPFHPFLSHIK
jgi:hypothetical protein